ncbi:MAG TPA: hypothetical protein V6D34_16670, partial [Candidatus Sericytochromatia bacterium]
CILRSSSGVSGAPSTVDRAVPKALMELSIAGLEGVATMICNPFAEGLCESVYGGTDGNGAYF